MLVATEMASKRRYSTPKSWEDIKEFVVAEKLKGQTHEWIISALEQERGIHVTGPQLKYLMRVWGISRTYRKSQMVPPSETEDQIASGSNGHTERPTGKKLSATEHPITKAIDKDLVESDETEPSSPVSALQEDVQEQQGANVGGLLIDLVELVSDILDTIYDLPLDSAASTKLEELQVKFDLWADGVDVDSGRLDVYISSSKHISKSMFTICLTFLQSILSDDGSALFKKAIQPYFEKTTALIEKIQFTQLDTNPDSKDQPQEEEEKPEQPPIEELCDGYTEFIEKFELFQQHLSDLAPYLLDFIVDCDEKEKITFLDVEDKELAEDDKMNQPIENEADLGPHHSYQQGIEEKFPGIDRRLSKRLAKEMWELYGKVKLSLQQGQSIADQTHANCDTETVAHDSAYESMQQSVAASLVQPGYKNLGFTFDDDARSDITSSSCQLSNRPIVPRLPESIKSDSGNGFVCPYCLKFITSIENRRQWRKHVLSDIRPYVCTFPNCMDSRIRYSSKASWMGHEVNEHRLTYKWHCNFADCKMVFEEADEFVDHLISFHHMHSIVFGEPRGLFSILASCKTPTLKGTSSCCPICSKELVNTPSRLASHIGRHLEDLALPVLCQFEEESDGSEEASTSLSEESVQNDDDQPRDGLLAPLKEFSEKHGYRCPKCDAVFNFKTNRTRHVNGRACEPNTVKAMRHSEFSCAIDGSQTAPKSKRMLEVDLDTTRRIEYIASGFKNCSHPRP